VQDLGRYEDRLLAFVTSRTGDAERRDRALERAGVYRLYGKVFAAYCRRSGDGVEGREATRRAVFLLWCSATQPCCLTGVGELGETMQVELIESVDWWCESGLDPQLQWMLAHYHALYPVAFRQFTWASALQRLLLTSSADAWRAVEPAPHHFVGRGLMGRYWMQLLQER
jgi:hypothetical protein